MDAFLAKLAEILDTSALDARSDIKALPAWDSLAILSIVAMLDADYGVNMRASDFESITSAGELWAAVQARRKA